MRLLAGAAIVVIALLAPPVRAAQETLRFATVAPEGSAWAREIRRFARDVEDESHGELHIKVYFGAIAGDELQMAERMRREQLDGVISGGMVCAREATSLRVLRLLGLVRDRSEAIYLINRLRSTFEREFEAHGLVALGIAVVGVDTLFSRTPIRSLADLRRDRYWIWDGDETVQKQMGALGVRLVPSPLSDAARLYDEHKVDGFSTVPGAALAFQWSAQARHVTALQYAILPGCALIAQRAFDPLSIEARRAVRSAGAKLEARFNELTASQDEMLLGRLFARQGLVTEAASPRFRAEFAAATVEARVRLGAGLVPLALVNEAVQILTDYRAHH
jgi:TRAP-type C4-dicarboxylate transport system substrate-binding protein